MLVAEGRPRATPGPPARVEMEQTRPPPQGPTRPVGCQAVVLVVPGTRTSLPAVVELPGYLVAVAVGRVVMPFRHPEKPGRAAAEGQMFSQAH